MPVTTTPALTQSINDQGIILLNATSAESVDNSGVVSNDVLVYTAGANGGILRGLMIASNDSAIRYLTFWLQKGGAGAKIAIGRVAVPITAGFSATAGIANVDALAYLYLIGLTLDQTGKPVLLLSGGTKLSVSLVAQITLNKAIYILPQGEDL